MLILVVGPSGAGKDTVLRNARAALGENGLFVFPRREITRDPALGGEDFVPVDEATFAAREAAGGYAFAWRAHGLCYGVPKTVEDDLRAGRIVVVNVSRSLVGAARERYDPVRVILVEAPIDVLSARLNKRGREDEHTIAARLARADAPVDIPDVIRLSTDRPKAESAADFISLLHRLAASYVVEKA